MKSGSYVFISHDKDEVVHFICKSLGWDNHKISQGIFPNFLLIDGIDDNLNLEQIDPLFDFVLSTGTLPTLKVVVVMGAHRLNRFAQNRLLKILEEPPLNTAIILVTHYPDRLLDTIRSRVFVKRFPLKKSPPLFDSNEIKNHLRTCLKNGAKLFDDGARSMDVMQATLSVVFNILKKDPSEKMLHLYHQGHNFFIQSQDTYLDSKAMQLTFFHILHCAWGES
jgi:hypothetical protein